MKKWKIEAQLDKSLIEPFMDNYKEIIKQNRNTVRKKFPDKKISDRHRKNTMNLASVEGYFIIF